MQGERIPDGHMAVPSAVYRNLIEERDATRARLAVLDGTSCAENRAAGRGGCGLCGWCCKQARDERDAALAQVARLKLALGNVMYTFKGKAVPDGIYATACEIANAALAANQPAKGEG